MSLSNEEISNMTRQNHDFVSSMTNLFNKYTPKMIQYLDKIQEFTKKLNNTDIKVNNQEILWTNMLNFSRYLFPNAIDSLNLEENIEISQIILELQKYFDRSVENELIFKESLSEDINNLHHHKIDDIEELPNLLCCLKYEIRKLISSFEAFTTDINTYKANQEIKFTNLQDLYDKKFNEQEVKIETVINVINKDINEKFNEQKRGISKIQTENQNQMKNIRADVEESISKKKELRELLTQRSTENSNEIEKRCDDYNTKLQEKINKTQQETINKMSKEQEELHEIHKNLKSEIEEIKEKLSSFKNENQDQMKNIRSYIEEFIFKLKQDDEKRCNDLDTKLQEKINKMHQEMTNYQQQIINEMTKKQALLKDDEEPVTKPTETPTTEEPKQEKAETLTAPSKKKKLSRQEKLAQRKQKEADARKQEEAARKQQEEEERKKREAEEKAQKQPLQDTPILDRSSNSKPQKPQQDTKKEVAQAPVPKKPPTTWENLVIQPDIEEKPQSKKIPRRKEEEPNKKLQQTNSSSQQEEKVQPINENPITEKVETRGGIKLEQEENKPTAQNQQPAPLPLKKNVWSAASIGLSEITKPIEIKSMMKPTRVWSNALPSDSVTPYDDSNEYRKVPAEMKHTHPPNQPSTEKRFKEIKEVLENGASSLDDTEQSKQQYQHENEKKLPVSPKVVQEQRKIPKQLSPSPHTAWAALTATTSTPYNDSKFVNKTPYELRNSHKRNLSESESKGQQKFSKNKPRHQPPPPHNHHQQRRQPQQLKSQLEEKKENLHPPNSAENEESYPEIETQQANGSNSSIEPQATTPQNKAANSAWANFTKQFT